MNNHVNPNRAITFAYVFKTVSVLAGLLAIYLGYDLFIRGVTGQASLSINAKDIKGQLLNASPGLFFALGGIVIIVTAIRRAVDTRSKSRSREHFVEFANEKAPDDKSQTTGG